MIVVLTQRGGGGGEKISRASLSIAKKMILGKEILLRVYHSLFIDIKGRCSVFF